MKGIKSKASLNRQIPLNSYHARYLKKVSQAQTMPKTSAISSNNRYQADISRRRQKIMSEIQKSHQTSIIRIEEDSFEPFISQQLVPKQEQLLLIKIAQIKQKQEAIYIKMADQQRMSLVREKQLTATRAKHRKLLQKRQQLCRSLQQSVNEEDHERYQLPVHPNDLKTKENEEQIKSLKADQETLTHEIKQIESKLHSLRQQFKRLEGVEQTEQTIQDQNDLADENQKIKQRIILLENDNAELEQKLNNIQSAVSPAEQLFRKFTDLYERLFMGRQLDKLSRLMRTKEELFRRQKEFQVNKDNMKQKKKEMDQLQKRIQEQREQVSILQNNIVQKSTQLLQVTHEYV